MLRIHNQIQICIVEYFAASASTQTYRKTCSFPFSFSISFNGINIGSLILIFMVENDVVYSNWGRCTRCHLFLYMVPRLNGNVISKGHIVFQILNRTSTIHHTFHGIIFDCTNSGLQLLNLHFITVFKHRTQSTKNIVYIQNTVDYTLQ